MNSENLLPVGSVVLLNNADKELMIIGILPVNDNKRFDYLAVLHPEGYLSEKYVFMFNHSDIAQVKFLGYMNAAYQVFRGGLSALFSEEENKPEAEAKEEPVKEELPKEE